MDSDKVLVMDSGEAIEFDHPHRLLQKPNGVFAGLVKETGKSSEEFLANIAKEVSYTLYKFNHHNIQLHNYHQLFDHKLELVDVSHICLVSCIFTPSTIM